MILLLGSHGFLGTSLSKSLNKKNLLRIDIRSKKKNEKININDYAKLEKVFKYNKIKNVINCVCEPATSTNKQKIFETNFYATKNLIKLCKKYKVQKLVFFSTSAIWVSDYKKPVTEKTKYFPVEDYGKSKIMAENVIINSNLKNWVIFRIPMIVSQNRLGILSILFEFIINNKKIPILGNGKNNLQFIHIDDLVNFVKKSLSIKEKEIYNLASQEIITFKKLILSLIKSTGSQSKILSFYDFGISKFFLILNYFRLSPLNIYHIKMLRYSFTMNCNKIFKRYKMKTKIKTSSMMIEALRNYQNKKKDNIKSEITKPIKMGIFKIIFKLF
jgi:UDP-glucose 4-epimerase